MLGAIIGDIAGSKYEFNNVRTEDFKLMGAGCGFTDDTICTVAVAEAAMSDQDYAAHLQAWCRRYPNPMGGYGGRFSKWIRMDRPEPYGSYENGAPMRCSATGWIFTTEEEVQQQARESARVTHNHRMGLLGAELVATGIFKMRHGAGKEAAAEGVEAAFGWLPEYRPFSNPFSETTMNAVPVAVSCFLASNSFEDAVRKAILVGGDSDTIGAITGSLAEAFYGIPDDLRAKALSFLPEDILAVYDRFQKAIKA